MTDRAKALASEMTIEEKIAADLLVAQFASGFRLTPENARQAVQTAVHTARDLLHYMRLPEGEDVRTDYCWCSGPEGDDPFCPCEMGRRGLTPSKPSPHVDFVDR